MRTNSFKDCILYGLDKIRGVSVAYLLGIGLSAPIFIPTIYGFFCSYRNGANVAPKVLYSLTDYIMEIPCLFTYGEEKGFMVNLGLLIVIIILFKSSKNSNHKKNIIVLCGLSQIALVGYIFNGFSYPSRRWFILCYFYFAYLVTEALDNTKKSIVSIILILSIIQPFVYMMNY